MCVCGDIFFKLISFCFFVLILFHKKRKKKKEKKKKQFLFLTYVFLIVCYLLYRILVGVVLLWKKKKKKKKQHFFNLYEKNIYDLKKDSTTQFWKCCKKKFKKDTCPLVISIFYQLLQTCQNCSSTYFVKDFFNIIKSSWK